MLESWLIGMGGDAWASPGVVGVENYSLIKDIEDGVVGGKDGAPLVEGGG